MCLVNDELTEEAYDGSLAGLSYSLYWDPSWRLRLEIKGYNEKMVVLLKSLLEKLCGHVVDERRFAVYEEEVCDI